MTALGLEIVACRDDERSTRFLDSQQGKQVNDDCHLQGKKCSSDTRRQDEYKVDAVLNEPLRV